MFENVVISSIAVAEGDGNLDSLYQELLNSGSIPFYGISVTKLKNPIKSPEGMPPVEFIIFTTQHSLNTFLS